MPRRTKLIIAALFLVLLAIPAVYAVLTWSAPNPLRFRVVKKQSLEKYPSQWSYTVQSFVVEVRNASSVPVELFGTILYRQTSLAKSSRAMIGEVEDGVLLLPPHFTPSGGYHTGPIPPGGSIYVAVGIWENTDIRSGEVEVAYNWVSRTKGNCMRWSNRCIGHLPSKIQEHMPRISLIKDESILDVSILTPQAEQPPAKPPASQ